MEDYTPSGLVPAIQHDGLQIWDSLAIAEYLAEVFPATELWPTDQKTRATARAISAEMHSGFQVIRNELSMNIRAFKPKENLSPELVEELQRVQAIWNDA